MEQHLYLHDDGNSAYLATNAFIRWMSGILLQAIASVLVPTQPVAGVGQSSRNLPVADQRLVRSANASA